MSEEDYDVAQICLNGHIINDSYIKYPGSNKEYCPECGEKTITKCPECKGNIKGGYFSSWAYYYEDNYKIPNYCEYCGSPFPWTEKKTKSIMELINSEEKLDEQERIIFENGMNDIIKNTPTAEASTKIIKRILQKISTETKDIIIKIIAEITSESIMKLLLP